MQTVCDYEFFVQLYVDGDRLRPIGQAPIGRDRWSPALECLRWTAARRDPRQQLWLPVGPLTVQPMWHDQLGEPYIRAVRAVVAGQGESTEDEFAEEYFAEAAEQLTRSLRDAGKLEGGTRCRFLVCAFPSESHPAEPHQEPAPRWSITPREQALVLRDESLDSLVDASEPCGDLADNDLPVFIPQHVLDEAVSLHEQAGAVETGGVLIGHLCRDPRHTDRLFARVTAQIPARHTRQDLNSLTFTAETWANADGLIRLRGGHERKLGWWHSHPARRWCEKCPEENRKVCKMSGEFFSQHDSALHRAAFPMAFSFALVVSDSYAEGLTFPAFGWRRGVLVRRGFHRLR